jgi:hypothetical protein
VFDATWLTLQRRGFEVVEHDRLAGSLKARRGGTTWSVEVGALGSRQRVELMPEAPVPRAELVALLDALEEGTATLLRAWADLPEWKFDARHNLLRLQGFSFSPPLEWQWLDFDISRRVATVQQARTRNVANPTLLIELDRTRPESALLHTVKRAVSASLGARQRVLFPDGLAPGTVEVLDGTTPQQVTWDAAEWTLDALQVRAVISCPGARCLPLAKPVLGSDAGTPR